jgi:predicted phage terminase large subunit-like protein
MPSRPAAAADRPRSAVRRAAATRARTRRREGASDAPPPVQPDAPLQPPAADDVLSWAQRFLPHYFTEAPAPFHGELLRDAADDRRRLIARIAPRGHAKSTCLALAYPLWCVCTQRRRNIVIVTQEASLATQFVRDLRVELESNEALRDAHGDLVDRAKWAEQKFTTVTGVTVQAKGARASFRGVRCGPQRPDLIIADDLEKDEDVSSPEGRRKLEHWLRRVVLPALAPEGRVIVLGSLLHYDCLLANLANPQRFPGWDYRVYRAREAQLLADGTARVEPLWPARWPLGRLDEERGRIGTLAFEQEYMANPVDDSQRAFKPEWLRRYDESELVPQRLVNLIAVDPATGANAGDFFALWVGSVDTATGIIYTRSLALERIGIVDQVQRIVAAADRWRPVRIAIETNAYQKALKDILDHESRTRGLYLPVVALHTRGEKRARIEGTAAFFENGTFRLPPALDPEAESQFLHFPRARHDDAPDVCAMGLELARSLRSLHGFRALRGRPTANRRHGW